LITFAELSTQLVNFDDYINKVIGEFEQSSVFKSYIDLSGTEMEDYEGANRSTFIRPLESFVDRLLFNEGRGKLALLGNFGTGKTTFCRKYAYELARHYKKDPTTRIPIVINLNDYEARLDIQELLTNTLQFRYGVRIDLTICAELQRLGRFLLMFDGFDEMATRVDPDIIRDNLREINKISRIQENKFIVTCRTHFFRDRVQSEILAGFDIIYIPEWGEEELKEYLEKHFSTQWRQQLRKIHDRHNLAELAQTPLFLEMIVETLPKLGDQVTGVELYRIYTDNWIEEQSRRRGARMSIDERRQFLRELATKLYVEDKLTCHYGEFISILRQRFEIADAAQMDYLQSDVRTCTFLTRDENGNYGFRHKSFMEFFIAQAMAEQIKNGSQELIRAKLLPLEIKRFLLDFIRRDQLEDSLKKLTSESQDQTFCDNAFALLASLRVDFSEVKLQEFSGDDLEVAQSLRGDIEAFSDLFSRYSGRLREYLRKLTKDNDLADETITEAYLKAWESKDRIDRIPNFRRHLFTVAKNLAFDKLRQRWKGANYVETSDLDDELFDSILLNDEKAEFHDVTGSLESQDTIYDRVAIHELLQKAIAQLSETEREVVTKRFFEDKPVRTVAQELGISVYTVSEITYRAREKLKTFLKENT
jgi:RNA polymerase sigma factor (sigma-70 family)